MIDWEFIILVSIFGGIFTIAFLIAEYSGGCFKVEEEWIKRFPRSARSQRILRQRKNGTYTTYVPHRYRDQYNKDIQKLHESDQTKEVTT